MKAAVLILVAALSLASCGAGGDFARAGIKYAISK